MVKGRINRKMCRKIWTWMLSILLVICSLAAALPAQTVHAASETYSVYIEGECNYDYANEVLTILNQVRKKAGKKPLIMNEELLRAAMRRAAEIAIDFNHVRPNKKKCFSVSDLIYGENIAMGQKSPKDVMDTWVKSQGHYKNMINADYKSVGIGVFYIDGKYYWVQCFGRTDEDEAEKEGTETKTYNIKVKGALDFRVSGSGKSLKAGKTWTPKITVKNRSYSSFSVHVMPKSLKYTSENKKLATVNSAGKITAKKKGTVKITCKLGTKKRTIKIKVK